MTLETVASLGDDLGETKIAASIVTERLSGSGAA